VTFPELNRVLKFKRRRIFKVVTSRGVLNKRNLVTVQRHFKDSYTMPSALSFLPLFRQEEKRNVTMDEHNWRKKIRSSYTVWCSI